MKHLKLFFACLLMAVLSIGQVWAVDPTISWDFKTLQTTSGTQSGITWETGKTGSANATACNSTNGLVLYGVTTGGGYFQTTSAISGTITNVNIVSTAKKNTPKYTVYCSTDGSTWDEIAAAQTAGTKDHAVTGSYTYVKVANTTAATAQLGVTSITVTYTPSGGGSTPSLSASPATIDFGTVYKDASVEDKAVAVTFANLTGSVSYSGLTSPFSASGSISASGDEIAISADASTIGEYEQTLTVQSAGDALSKTVTVTMKVVAAPEPTGTFELFSGDIEEGDYVLVGYQTSSSKYYAMNSTVTSNQYLGITEVSIDANDQIVNPDASLVWTIEQSTNGYYIKQGSAYLDDNATSNKNYAQTVAEPTTTSEWAFAYDNTWTITNYGTETTKKTLSFNISASRVACYTAIQSGNTCFYLYKKVDGAVKPSAGLAFDAAQKLAKVAGTLTAPNLSTAAGFDGTVTYASSDETVVKVNASTGAITEIVAAGKAVITAHSDATENFKEGSASYTIFVAEQAGTNEDPLTEASAKALIDDGCTLTVHVNGLVLSQNSTNFTVTLTNGFQFYKAKDLNNVAFESAYLGAGDEVTAVGALKKFSSTYELDEGCYLTFYEAATTPLTPIANDKDHPYTVAQALAFAAAPTTYDLSDHVFIQGVVYKANSFNSDNGTYNIYIKDAGTSEDDGKFEFFKCSGLYQVGEAVVPFEEGDVQEGDEVIGYGVMTYYSGGSIWEFNQPNQLVSLNRPAVAVTGIDLTESTAEVEVGSTVTLHASVVPGNATDQGIVWSVTSGSDKASVDENGVVTGTAAGEAVIRAASDENASIYEECTVTVTEPAPLSPWASVYTSNVTLSTEGGTSASAAKVKFYGEEGDGYDAIKAGTGSAQGAVVVNVPAGATALHFHAYGWNSESVGLTVTAPTGVTVSPATEISINSNSGIASNSPFTLAEGSDPKTDAYYAVSLSGNTEATNITISATSGKRFVLFGVNQEGGLVLESIAVFGTASVLEYNDGDHFDPTGLVVTGHYSDDSEATISEGIDWTFDPDPLTEGTTSVSVTATVGEISSAAVVVNGLTVNGAAPLSPWATTWTSNLDDITGSKVKFYGEETEYAALKAGSGSVAGTATLNIPAQATELHLHAYGWNSEDVTLSITAPDGVTVTPASINLNRNSGFASNSPFTLAEGSTPQTDAYYALSLSGNTDAIELTISATEGKRFLLFGVNQVGGVLPELQSIAISGDLDNKSYKAGQALDMTGLTVTATYTLGGTPQTPVDVTNDPGLTWTYDPLAEGDTQKEVTANFGGKTANKTIEGLTVASADPAIYVDPSLYVNFGSVDKDAALPADQTITVTLTNVAAGTATLAGADVFNIDKTALVEGENVITISVASTATAGEFSATITLTDNASAAPQKVVNLSFTVNEPVTPEDPEVRKTWDLSIASYDANPTEEQVTWSATYVNMVVDKYNATTKANNYLGGDANNRTSSRFYQNSKLTITPNGKEITSVVFTATSAGYANALQGSEWTNASASVDGTTVTVTPTDGKNAIIAVVGGTCGFTAVQVNYKNIAPEPPVVDYTEVRNDLTEGWYYTMCLDKAVTAVKAGSIWRVLSKAANGKDVILEEAELPLVAGRPYIFRAAASTLEVAYTGDAVLAPVTEGNNGLIGSFTQEPIAQSPNNFIIYNNALYYVNSDNVKVGAHRAYLDMTGVPAYSNEPLQGNAPRRRVTMAVYGEQTTTGIDALNAAEAPVKVLINGQMYILRGEKMYNVNGQVVK